MKDYPAFLQALKSAYVPSMYELHGDRTVAGDSRAYPWTGSMLYYQIFRQVFPYLKEGSRVMDLGAYPGTFLRVLRTLGKQKQLELFGYGMVCETDEIRKYNLRHEENPKTKCITTPK